MLNRIDLHKQVQSVGYWQNADLCVDEWHANGIIADYRTQSAPDVRQLNEKRLDHLVAGYERFPASSIYDVGRPHQWHPILGHGASLVHHFHDFFFALQHDSCVMSKFVTCSATQSHPQPSTPTAEPHTHTAVCIERSIDRGYNMIYVKYIFIFILIKYFNHATTNILLIVNYV